MDGEFEVEDFPNNDEGLEGKNGSNGLVLSSAGDERYGYIEDRNCTKLKGFWTRIR